MTRKETAFLFWGSLMATLAIIYLYFQNDNYLTVRETLLVKKAGELYETGRITSTERNAIFEISKEITTLEVFFSMLSVFLQALVAVGVRFVVIFAATKIAPVPTRQVMRLALASGWEIPLRFLFYFVILYHGCPVN